MVGTIATILVSAAAMFEGLLGWSFWLSVGVTSVLVGVYTVSGGLRAVVYTDVVSCVVLIAGAALMCFTGLREIGGIGNLVESVSTQAWTADHFDLLPSAAHPDYPWPAVVLGLGFVLGPAYWIGNQAIVQRTLGTKSARDARASYVLCAVIKLVFPVLLVLPGLLVIGLFANEFGPPQQTGTPIKCSRWSSRASSRKARSAFSWGHSSPASWRILTRTSTLRARCS